MDSSRLATSRECRYTHLERQDWDKDLNDTISVLASFGTLRVSQKLSATDLGQHKRSIPAPTPNFAAPTLNHDLNNINIKLYRNDKNKLVGAGSMPTITSRLAWALEVDPAEVIARVNEEVQYRLTADTLRLCNVYGTGDKATITKLPKELIDLIEEYLNDEKLAAAAHSVVVATNAQRCYTRACTPFRDHFSDEQKLDMIDRELHKWALPTVTSLCEERADNMAKWIVRNELDVDHRIVQPDHGNKLAEWNRLVGTPGEAEQDAISKAKECDFILQYYGLELCIGHQNRGWGSYNTAAYLTLPNTVYERVDEVMVEDCGTPSKGRSVPAEEGFIAYEVTVPRPLTTSERARFGSMFAKLGVPGWKSASSDEERKEQHKRTEPKLMMLAKVMCYQ
ncbi:hypothetical protein LTR27_009742 [Elasticomyces elasticus]|nr:hypothetical protein LTR27_009742 [Elasticomyces elasticus]